MMFFRKIALNKNRTNNPKGGISHENDRNNITDKP
jgi:hypothetical protein